MIVVNPRKPEWGPGLVIKVEPTKIWVIWRDTPTRVAKAMATSVVKLELAPEQSDPILDALTPAFDKDGNIATHTSRRPGKPRKSAKVEATPISVEEAKERFLARFPEGFNDASYIGGTVKGTRKERAYKVDAHKNFVEDVGGGRYEQLLSEDPAELCERLKRAMRSTNLASPYEKASLADALDQVDHCIPYLQALGGILTDRVADESAFEAYFKALSELPAEGSSPAKWPNATIFPYLYDPCIHIFLKPEVTKGAARSIRIDLNYRPLPNWLTYSRLLEIADKFLTQLRPLGAKDMIDVQSFIWVVYGGYK